ncbi:MAG: S1 RNA-binding domain-containing protein [Ruminococcus sp.]|nr:S1 RNA-binding domain-containing protein [Ruminococcus sp.]
MQLEVGKIYEGKVTGITKFGAFVELDKDTTGMVHISEVANTYVSEIKEHIKEGETVKVKVLNLGDDGKISLSIKKALPQQPRRNDGRGGRGQGDKAQGRRQTSSAPRPAFERKPQNFSKNPPPVYDPSEHMGNADFEDMMSRFKAASDEKFSDLKKITDNKRRSPSRRK